MCPKNTTDLAVRCSTGSVELSCVAINTPLVCSCLQVLFFIPNKLCLCRKRIYSVRSSSCTLFELKAFYNSLSHWTDMLKADRGNGCISATSQVYTGPWATAAIFNTWLFTGYRKARRTGYSAVRWVSHVLLLDYKDEYRPGLSIKSYSYPCTTWLILQKRVIKHFTALFRHSSWDDFATTTVLGFSLSGLASRYWVLASSFFYDSSCCLYHTFAIEAKIA